MCIGMRALEKRHSKSVCVLQRCTCVCVVCRMCVCVCVCVDRARKDIAQMRERERNSGKVEEREYVHREAKRKGTYLTDFQYSEPKCRPSFGPPCCASALYL